MPLPVAPPSVSPRPVPPAIVVQPPAPPAAQDPVPNADEGDDNEDQPVPDAGAEEVPDVIAN